MTHEHELREGVSLIVQKYERMLRAKNVQISSLVLLLENLIQAICGSPLATPELLAACDTPATLSPAYAPPGTTSSNRWRRAAPRPEPCTKLSTSH